MSSLILLLRFKLSHLICDRLFAGVQYMNVSCQLVVAVLLKDNSFGWRKLQHIWKILKRFFINVLMHVFNLLSTDRSDDDFVWRSKVKSLSMTVLFKPIWHHLPFRVSKLEVDSSDIGDGDSERLLAKWTCNQISFSISEHVLGTTACNKQIYTNKIMIRDNLSYV